MKSFKEQFDKLTSAYISGKVYPQDTCACFVGNLLEGTTDWASVHCGGDWNGWDRQTNNAAKFYYERGVMSIESFGYTPDETYWLEKNFMDTIGGYDEEDGELYERQLFEAFASTLDILREIHISKGEIIDETPEFTKRKLQHENV